MKKIAILSTLIVALLPKLIFAGGDHQDSNVNIDSKENIYQNIETTCISGWTLFDQIAWLPQFCDKLMAGTVTDEDKAIFVEIKKKWGKKQLKYFIYYTLGAKGVYRLIKASNLLGED